MTSRVNERTLALLAEIVSSQPGISPTTVAEAMGITTRSIRICARQFNESGEPCAHLDLAHGGYRISAADSMALNVWCAHHYAESYRVSDAPEERMAYLASNLLSRTDWVTLDTLASTLSCSSRTIFNDLRQVDSYLASSGLKPEKRPRYSICGDSSEMKRRVYLSNNVLNRMRPALEEASIHVSAVSYQNLLVHIAISVGHIRAGRFVPLDPASGESIRYGEGGYAAECLARAIAAHSSHCSCDSGIPKASSVDLISCNNGRRPRRGRRRLDCEI